MVNEQRYLFMTQDSIMKNNGDNSKLLLDWIGDIRCQKQAGLLFVIWMVANGTAKERRV